MNETWKSVVEAGTALATAVAALLAGWSAWYSRSSARAAEAAVGEAREARRAELAPRLVMEKDFLDLAFNWPQVATSNAEPAFLARKNAQDLAPTNPTFSLANFGASPALEVAITFEFEDPNGDFTVPAEFERLGLAVHDGPAAAGSPPIKVLFYTPAGGNACGLPLYRRWTVDVPNCSPGRPRTVEFPKHLLNTLFLRGLQQWHRQRNRLPFAELVLTVRLHSHAIDGTAYETQFRFKLLPFAHAPVLPLTVASHCHELPMYPRPAEANVV